MTTKPRGHCTCPHTHEVAPPPASPPVQRTQAPLLRDLLAKQERAFRDLTFQAVSVGNRIVGVEAKAAEVRDQIQTISTRLAAPATAEDRTS